MSDTSDNLHCFVSDSHRVEPTGQGILTGTTVAVKDLFALEDHTSSFGHPRWRETHEPSRTTAPVVERLLATGATIVGLTKMDQLAYSLVGNVGEGEAPLNSLYPDRFTGGSSSGTVSAVAGNIADIGLGSDTGGSIRIPAAACGLYSVRPTHDRISSEGTIPLAESFDTVGICARDPHLLTTVFELLRSEAQPTHPLQRILVFQAALDIADPAVRDGVDAIAQQLGKHIGIAVERISGEELVNPAVGELFARIQSREIWKNHGEWVEQYKQFLAEDVRLRLDNARHRAEASAAEQNADRAAWDAYRRQFAALVPSGTLVVLPVMEGLPPKRDASADELKHFRTIAFGLSAVGSLTGAPEVVVPWTHPVNGNSYGIGLLGARSDDETLLALVESFTKNL